VTTTNFIHTECIAVDATASRLFLLGQTVQLHFKVVQTTVAPVVPANSLDCGVGKRCGEEGRPKPCVGNPLSGHPGDSQWHIRLEPGSVRTNVSRVSAGFQLFYTTAFMGGVQGGVTSTVNKDTRKDKGEGVEDKGSRRLGKAERAAKVLSKGGLRCMVSHSQTSGNTDNVLCTSAPELFVDGTVNELVEVSIIHLIETFRKAK
jgi:hypothetical protein